MNIITSYDINEVYTRIKVKKPIRFNNKIILNIYDIAQENLLFQSPVMYLPYNYIYDTNVIKTMDLCEYNDNKFINFLTLLYKKIINKINFFNSSLFEDKKFYSNIILNSQDNKIKMVRFKEVYINKLNVYDFRNDLININQIVRESKIKCIFMIKNVWINEDRYGFNLELLQIQNKDFTNNNWKGKNVLLFGSEGFGLKSKTLMHSDFKFKVLMDKNIESLNISNTVSVVCHHIYQKIK